MSYALNISERNIISIREYCNEFLNIKYSKEGKLTHNRLREYAYEKGIKLPKRCIFKDINKEDILRGDCYLVKDESGKIIAYYGLINLNTMINSLEQNKKMLEARRNQLLGSMGYKETVSDGCIPIDEVDPSIYEEEKIKDLGSLLNKNNRIKRLLKGKR